MYCDKGFFAFSKIKSKLENWHLQGQGFDSCWEDSEFPFLNTDLRMLLHLFHFIQVTIPDLSHNLFIPYFGAYIIVTIAQWLEHSTCTWKVKGLTATWEDSEYLF